LGLKNFLREIAPHRNLRLGIITIAAAGATEQKTRKEKGA